MEKKPTRSMSRILSFLPRTTSIFPHQPFSPGRDKHYKFAAGKAFSGPIISIFPAESRRDNRTGRFDDAQEPTSPKVSCIGQIKHKKKICKAAKSAAPAAKSDDKKERQRASSVMGKFFRGVRGGGKPPRRPKANTEAEVGAVQVGGAPKLGQMRRFSSGREAFKDFDWEVSGGAGAANRLRGYYSEEERGEESEEEDDVDDEEFKVPYSAPLTLTASASCGGRLEPKKEINLWKRRTLAPPRPLQLRSPSNYS